jgi:hypothetical protein
VALKKRLVTSRLPSVAAALLAGLALLGLPACETGTPAQPAISSSQIAVSVDPSPVVGSQNSATAAVTAKFDVKIQELNGLGCEVVFVNVAAFDKESGAQISLVYYDGTDLVVIVGSKRIEAQGTLVVPETVSYTLSDGRKEAIVTVAVQVRDDRGNLLNRSVMAQIQ